jgi:hypothetical protein
LPRPTVPHCHLGNVGNVPLAPEEAIWRSHSKGPAARDTGRGSLASDGERQPSLPRCVRKSMRQIRTIISATKIDLKLLRAADLQYEGYLRREETNAAILARRAAYRSSRLCVIQAIARKLVRQIIRGERNDVVRTRQSSSDLHLPWLDDQWASGCRNGAEVWGRLQAAGFRCSLRVVSEWTTRRRRAEKADAQNLQRIPSARTIARLMTIGRDLLTKAETVTVAAVNKRPRLTPPPLRRSIAWLADPRRDPAPISSASPCPRARRH